jgi:hypothetical protein
VKVRTRVQLVKVKVKVYLKKVQSGGVAVDFGGPTLAKKREYNICLFATDCEEGNKELTNHHHHHNGEVDLLTKKMRERENGKRETETKTKTKTRKGEEGKVLQ